MALPAVHQCLLALILSVKAQKFNYKHQDAYSVLFCLRNSEVWPAREVIESHLLPLLSILVLRLHIEIVLSQSLTKLCLFDSKDLNVGLIITIEPDRLVFISRPVLETLFPVVLFNSVHIFAQVDNQLCILAEN